jgi:hypothetical protein
MTKRHLTFKNLILEICRYINQPYCNCDHCSKVCLEHKYCKSKCIKINMVCKKDKYWQSFKH